MKSILQEYLATTPPDEITVSTVAYLANLESVSQVAPDITRAIIQELRDQRGNLKLIASENYSSLAVQLAMGNLLTDKYAEGFPQHRFYAGCDNVDLIEDAARREACALFGADHAFVQPHCGADANLIAYWAILRTRVELPEMAALNETNPMALSREQWDALRFAFARQKLLAMDLYSGGHLTHGYRQNVSARMFDCYGYSVNPETYLLDYSEINRMAQDVRPLILLAGYSAYPRPINFAVLREIAESVGAVFMVDMAHFAGLVAGGVFTGDYNPVAHAHVVTTTTHKTLRGPRGGMVLCQQEFSESVDKGCPLVMGGPLPHMLAAKAVAFKEANTPAFKAYARRVVENARVFAAACMDAGMSVLTGGTDNHLFLIDVQPFGLTGRQAESALRECAITLNRNALPYDPNGPWYTSGLRLGTPATTTLGMGADEMREMARIIKLVLSHTHPIPKEGTPDRAHFTLDPAIKAEATSAVHALLDRYPVYPELKMEWLEQLATAAV